MSNQGLGTMTKCVMKLLPKIPQLPHNLFGQSSKLAKTFGISWKKVLTGLAYSLWLESYLTTVLFYIMYLAGLSACKASYQTAVHRLLVRGGHSQSYISQVQLNKYETAPNFCRSNQNNFITQLNQQTIRCQVLD